MEHERNSLDRRPPALSKESALWARRADQAVREELADRYLAFAKSIAMKYRGKAESTEDLVQVASLGLMYAIKRFDPSKGVPFVGFASPTIHGELRRHFRDRVSTMRVPRDLYDRIGQMQATIADLRTTLSHEPESAEIAELMECSVEEVDEAREASASRNPVPLSAPSDDEAAIEDHVGAVDGRFEKSEERMVTGDALDALDDEDRELLVLRYKEEMTQTEIAERVGCSQMQISRRLRSILDTMRSSIRPTAAD